MPSRGFSQAQSDLPLGWSEEAQERTHNLALFFRTLRDYPYAKVCLKVIFKKKKIKARIYERYADWTHSERDRKSNGGYLLWLPYPEGPLGLSPEDGYTGG